MKMVLGRTYMLATTKGHMIKFTKDEPTHVPDVCIPDAVAIGAMPVDGSAVDVIGDEKRKVEGPSDPVEREKDLLAAVELIVGQNSRKDFTGAGVPSTDAMTRVLGYDIGAAERNAIWQVYCNNKAENEAA